MNYCIYPIGGALSTYVWRHATIDAAKSAAQEISKTNKCDVVVTKVMGTYKHTVEWEEAQP